MKEINEEILQFFQKQSFVIVSSIDKEGFPHCSCKGILEIDETGKIYLVDLYKGKTYENLIRNPHISITAVDEKYFRGYCLKGKAQIISQNKFTSKIKKTWEEKITGRISKRILENIHAGAGRLRQPEVLLPKPEYMIVMEVEKIIDLTPSQIK